VKVRDSPDFPTLGKLFPADETEFPTAGKIDNSGASNFQGLETHTGGFRIFLLMSTGSDAADVLDPGRR